MFAPDDTIVAVATPEGRAGLGVIRVSGPAAADVARALLGRTRPLPRRRAVLGRVREATCARGNGAGWIDQVVATYFKAPASYTGEDVVEIGAHVNPVLLRP